MTDAERHARATTLFHEALTLPTEQRADWLQTACPNPDLRRTVQTMLDHQLDTGLLDAPLLPRPHDARIGTTVGPWRVTGVLGEGGMGTVYSAERVDDTFDQQAALKLVRPGLGAGFEARFIRERALLAGLDHPGVARLLDGGVTSHGAPYLALERIDGEPITTYSERRQIDVRARLALFLQACDAVAYAHRSLVVHRDLKPAHILVTDAEHVKLLDFGIAKLLDADEELMTQTSAGPMTPAYAAPEQILRQPVTTATDVYALGVVLFELLTGDRPYDLTTLTASEVERVVTQDRPPRPSEAATNHRSRQLEGDLDTIVLKALAKDPERRYASADALADDLRRYLDGLPVRARPDTAGYRLTKFLGRHRAGVTATAAVATLLAALIGVYTVRLSTERDHAQNQAERAEAIAGFLEQILRAPNARWYNESDATGPDTPIRAVLDEAAARIDREFATQPDLRADLHHIVGDTYFSLGLFDAAKPHHLKTLALRESLYTPPHPKLAEALYYANGYLADGDRLRALEIGEQTLEMMRQVGEGNNFPFLAQSMGRAYRDAGRLRDAEAVVREGFAYAEDTFVPGRVGHRYRDPSMMVSAHRLSTILMDRGAMDDAARWLATADSLATLLPRRSAYYSTWQELMCSRGRLLRMQSRYPQAERALLACVGVGPPRGLASPFPISDPAPPPPTGASLELVALYDAWNRPADAAPHREAASRYVAARDSVRQVYARSE